MEEAFHHACLGSPRSRLKEIGCENDINMRGANVDCSNKRQAVLVAGELRSLRMLRCMNCMTIGIRG
ncbi:hypothetical protein JHK85_018290 [Glycine max]|nr:hypothetical protein JHK85_018290 [Glycine max]KHN04622.1 hypothetical protein glysoja_021921 [Glycine soja]